MRSVPAGDHNAVLALQGGQVLVRGCKTLETFTVLPFYLVDASTEWLKVFLTLSLPSRCGSSLFSLSFSFQSSLLASSHYKEAHRELKSVLCDQSMSLVWRGYGSLRVWLVKAAWKRFWFQFFTGEQRPSATHWNTFLVAPPPLTILLQ